MKNIAVLGDGAWGTAMAQLLAGNGHQVTLWCHNAEIAHTIASTRLNSNYLPGITLSERITPTTSLKKAFESSIIFEAIPIKFLRTVLMQAKAYSNANHRWVILSKGIENKTLLLPREIIAKTLPHTVVSSCVVLAGPSYAHDVATQQPTMVTIASSDRAQAQYVQGLVHNAWFVAELSEDIIGVQLCAAYKNVAALCIGMLEGAGYGENTRILALIKCLDEMHYLISARGGNLDTVYGPSGLGDLILTGLGSQSKNRTVGLLLGKGNKLEQALAATGYVPEGINTVVSLQQFAQRYSLVLPICAAVHAIIFNQQSVSLLVQLLTAV